ncbi:MAG: hypothetical protein PHX34_05215 [Candidatus Shapirobacteria bacterium]|nr:hypothetical protein [Candidatus Shapirobacteria bacterium]
MAEFKRSRLKRKTDQEVTKKAVFLGFLTIIFAIAVLVFGLPLLIRFSVFLGSTKKTVSSENKNLPPLAPRLVLPFEATKSGKIDVNGFAEPGVTVELFKNSNSVGKMDVDNDGDFTFENIELNEGDNSFSAKAFNEKDGDSEESTPLSVVYDTYPPELELTNPSETDLTVDYSDFDIVGKTDVGASVSINDRIAVVDSDGNFKLKWQLNMGKNSLNVKAVDEAGNETNKTINITYSF